MNDALRYFLAGLIDYAGIFPPAALPLEEALCNHARYLTGDHGWLLSRFVVPLARLRDMPIDGNFPLAVIVPMPLSPEDINLLSVFRKRIALVETRLDNADGTSLDCTALLEELQHHLLSSGLQKVRLFLEPARCETAAESIAVFNRSNEVETPITSVGLKLRCAATDIQAAPVPANVAATIDLCHRLDIPMKFTAGLHQPLSRYNAKTGEMRYGFLNIFAAALLSWASCLATAQATICLTDDNPGNFHFDNKGLRWRDSTMATDEIQRIRRDRVISFGSCSFDEPLEALQALGLLGSKED